MPMQFLPLEDDEIAEVLAKAEAAEKEEARRNMGRPPMSPTPNPYKLILESIGLPIPKGIPVLTMAPTVIETVDRILTASEADFILNEPDSEPAVPLAGESVRFSDIAQPFINLGIRVFPLVPKAKYPVKDMHFVTEASSDPNVVAAWSKLYPDSNVGLLADDQFCFLDFDLKRGLQDAASEMGEPVPQTRVQRTGKGFDHFIFRHTDKSRALGNRDAEKPTSGEWFSFRAKGRFIVAAGSTHPNGTVYQTLRDREPIPVPDWLCDWIEGKTKPARAVNTTPKSMPVVDEDFDFDDFCDHFALSGGWKGDNWFIPEVCPIAGRRHEQSIFTGFYYDGEHLGFNCFAGGCEGSSMSIGQVVSYLTEEHGRYPEPIWPRKEEDMQALSSKWGGDLDFGYEEGKTPTITPVVSKPEITALPPMDTDDEALDIGINELKDSGEIARDAFDLAPSPTYGDIRIKSEAPDSGFEFPTDALYGKLGDLCHAYPKLPPGWFYPSLIGIASGQVFDTNEMVRSSIFVANLGPPNAGKSVCQDMARRLISLRENTVETIVPGSHSGLINLMDETEPRPIVLFPDELKLVMNACAIQGSSLAGMLCRLFYYDDAGGAVKNTTKKGYANLSLVGALPVNDAGAFGQIFGAETTSGLYDRFLFGYSGTKIRNFRIPKHVIPEQMVPKMVYFHDGHYEALDRWEDIDPISRRRIREYAMRIMLVTAGCNGDTEVTKPCFEAALRFMEWQERLRAHFRPGMAETKDAQAFESVYAALKEVRDNQIATGTYDPAVLKLNSPPDTDAKRSGLLHFTNICNQKSLYRKFNSLIGSARKSLVNAGFIEAMTEEIEHDGKFKKSPTPFVKLRQTVD